MRSRFEALKGQPRDYKLYVRFDANINGNGGGGAGNGGADSGAVVDPRRSHRPGLQRRGDRDQRRQPRLRRAGLRRAATPTAPFREVTSGFAGSASDGLAQLDAEHRLTTDRRDAAGGNVVQTALLDPDRGGDGDAGARLRRRPAATPSRPRAQRCPALGEISRDYAAAGTLRRGSSAAAVPARPDPSAADRARAQYYLSANVRQGSRGQDVPRRRRRRARLAPGARRSSAGDPDKTYFGSYREVFARDLYEAWTALVAAGDLRTARDTVRFLFERQQLPDGSMPRNSLVNGKTAPDSFNTQLDEVAYPILMALARRDHRRGLLPRPHQARRGLRGGHGPSFGPERWEEQSGFSPSTIAAEIAGLIAAARDREAQR